MAVSLNLIFTKKKAPPDEVTPQETTRLSQGK